jgi:hypothetical protein
MRKLGLVISALAIIAAASADAAEPDRTYRDCKTPDAPYRDYDCLDAYLGDGFLAACRTGGDFYVPRILLRIERVSLLAQLSQLGP